MNPNNSLINKSGGQPGQQPGSPPSPDLFTDVICTCDEQGCFRYMNSASTILWGYDPWELTGQKWEDFISGEDRETFERALEQALGGAAVLDVLVHVRCKDGRLQPTIWSLKWREGVYCCTARNGSLRRASENRVSRNEQRLLRAYRLAQLGWWEWSAGEGRLVLSEELFELYGLSPLDEDGGFSVEAFLSLICPEDLPAVRRQWTLGLEASSFRFEHRFRRPTGELLYVRHEVATIRDREGQLIGVHGTTKDITKAKVSEQAIEASQKKLEQIIERLGDGFFAVDRDWTVRYWNQKVEQITHIKREDILGKKLWDVYGRERAPVFYQEYTRALEEGVPVHFEASSPMYQRWLEASAYPSEEGLSVFLRDLSEQKKEQQRRLLDEQLQAATENLRRVLDSMSDGFFILDRAWTITFANDRVARMLGIQKEEMVGRNVWEWLPKSVYTGFYTAYHRAFAQNTLVSVEDFLPHFNMWFEANAYPNGDELSVFVRNIDERKRQERALQVSIERFHFVSMATSDVIWDWNVETGERYINQSFTRAFGYELPDVKQPRDLWEQNLHPGDRDRVISSQAAALLDKHTLHWEESYRFIKKSGEVAYVSDRAVILRDDEGRALRMVGALQDTTERRRQQRRLEFIARASSEVIWERSLDQGHIVLSGGRFRQLFGHDLKDNHLPVSLWRENVHPEDLPAVLDRGRAALRKGEEFFSSEYRFRRSDGSWAYARERVYIERSDLQKPVALVGATEDITQERLAEKALLESEQSYKQLFDSDPLPKVVYDLETLSIVDVNSTAIAHYGYTHQEFTAMTIWDLRPGDEYPRVTPLTDQLEITGTRHLGIFVHRRKNGERIQVEVSVTTIVYHGRKANLASMNDVTEKIRLQQALARQATAHQQQITKVAIEAQEKERSEIGRELHDNVNQILTSAKLYVEQIGYYPEQGAVFAAKGVGLLQKSINEIRRLSRALVTPDTTGENFPETLRELVDSYRELCLFEVDFSFAAGEIDSKALRLTIFRILQEAFSNTVKYAGASLVSVWLERHGDLLHLLYRDNGAGFSPSAKKKGIGLKNIRSRAEAYLGKVHIRSARGKGFELSVSFPVGKGPAS